ncbi:hypothetical protein FB45DRAFT_979295 [Roridomyces roridus]|uniref:J domain-containing protein n=1 Tax=Roridomyces roridus TaxID=1738132 RepID=A0AAD7BVB5_9AGAR|nr:hypothetical protein FB45DRAFT_979295 [Roridomyces roridus]
MSRFPDYYKLLSVSTFCYKESLRTHPDRIANASPEQKKQATEKFQASLSRTQEFHAVADAYYVLSDPTRRKEYDALYSTRSRADRTEAPGSSSSFFNQFSGMFGGPKANTTPGGAQPDAEGVFADVFEELLRPEVERRAPWWAYVGAVCGAGIGFIMANFPGLMLGAVAGNRLGAVRDAKGKAVAAVFSELGGSQKAEILRALALKVLGTAL